MTNSQGSDTPVTDAAFTRLSHEEALAIANYDRERLAVERSTVSPGVAAKMFKPTHSIENMMREWERLIRELAAGWTTTDRVFVDDYLFVVDTRAGLEVALKKIAPRAPRSIWDAVRELDNVFLSCTIQEEEGEILGGLLKPHPGRPPEWLWNRRPHILPWQHGKAADE